MENTLDYLQDIVDLIKIGADITPVLCVNFHKDGEFYVSCFKEDGSAFNIQRGADNSISVSDEGGFWYPEEWNDALQEMKHFIANGLLKVAASHAALNKEAPDDFDRSLPFTKKDEAKEIAREKSWAVVPGRGE